MNPLNKGHLWDAGKCSYSVFTVEPPNKGHFGGNNFVPCREVVPFSEVK